MPDDCLFYSSIYSVHIYCPSKKAVAIYVLFNFSFQEVTGVCVSMVSVYFATAAIFLAPTTLMTPLQCSELLRLKLLKKYGILTHKNSKMHDDHTLNCYSVQSLKLQRHVYPWRRSFDVNKFADWEKKDDYCATLHKSILYKAESTHLNFVDIAVFDFLTG